MRNRDKVTTVNGNDLLVVLSGQTSRDRKEVEVFAERVYKGVYRAELKEFCNELMAIFSPTKGVVGCVGINEAGKTKLMIEEYLDAPVEVELNRVLGKNIDRKHIIEVGTFAARSGHVCRLLMAALSGLLVNREKRYMVFAATANMRSAFAKLGVPFIKIKDADKARSNNAATSGTYYDAMPEIVVVDMKCCLSRLVSLVCSVKGGLEKSLIAMMDKLFGQGVMLEAKVKS